MKKGILFGIIGGIIIFAVLLAIVWYKNSDFDQQLIEDVNGGMTAEELTPMIVNETLKEDLIAKKRLDSHVMDSKDWENGNLASNYNYNTEIYHKEMGFIIDYDKVRKEFVNKQISKEQFLDESDKIKEKLYSIR